MNLPMITSVFTAYIKSGWLERKDNYYFTKWYNLPTITYKRHHVTDVSDDKTKTTSDASLNFAVNDQRELAFPSLFIIISLTLSQMVYIVNRTH